MDEVERVARAIARTANGADPWDAMPEWRRDRYRDQARAAIAALRSPDLPVVKLGEKRE